MAECPYCHQQHPDHLQFCPQTGGWLDVRACPGCGRPVDRQLSLCPDCGAALASRSPIGKPVHLKIPRRAAPALYAGGLILAALIAAAVWAGFDGERAGSTATPTATIESPTDAPAPTLDEGGAIPAPPVTAAPGIIGSAPPTPETLSGAALSEIPPPANVFNERPPSPYSGWVVYAYGIGTGREIFITDPDSGRTIQITRNSDPDQEPCFAPDGWRLAYSSKREPDGWDLFGSDLQTGVEWQITHAEDQARFPSWSPIPGDERIAFQLIAGSASVPASLAVVLSDGSRPSRITPSGPDGQPIWSPDGRWLLFGRALQDTAVDGEITLLDNLNLHLLEIATGGIVRLTNNTAEDDYSYSWSPDGTQIVFASVRSDVNEDGAINLDDSRDLFLFDLESRRERRLDLGGKFTFGPRWSPDGGRILFGEKVAENTFNFWIFDLKRGEMTPLLSEGPYYHAGWIP